MDYQLPPEAGILKVAQDRDVDLIVMGVHQAVASRGAAHPLWSVAYDVVCSAHCPVLTVRG